MCVWTDLVLHKSLFPSTDITTFGKIDLISSCIFPKPQISMDEDSWTTLMCVFVVCTDLVLHKKCFPSTDIQLLER